MINVVIKNLVTIDTLMSRDFVTMVTRCFLSHIRIHQFWLPKFVPFALKLYISLLQGILSDIIMANLGIHSLPGKKSIFNFH